MKLIVEVKDNKAAFLVELLKSFSFVKTQTISPAKAQVLEEIKEAVENLNQVKAGKSRAKDARQLLNEL